MIHPNSDVIEQYYNERVDRKLRDFTDFNPRIEAAIQTIAEWAPPEPRRILEIGCGIGATSWRMARAWPGAQVLGIDISARSIEVATTCFERSNLSYRVAGVGPGMVEGEFDLVVMTDVYEHIALSDRPDLHAALRQVLSPESRLILTVPTPEYLECLAEEMPEELQPVDEHITEAVIATLIEEAQVERLFYRKVGIWRYGDYAHHVLGRRQPFAKVALRCGPVNRGRRHAVKRALGLVEPDGLTNYLGRDFLASSPTNRTAGFAVSRAERRRHASAWTNRKS
jgi:2-polyprenyl-3-methyl-5-hydroxy-6-metoxy-1,4-benzoquinol methylase